MPKVTVHFWPPSATKTGELRFVHRHFSIEGKKTLFGPKAHLVRHSESGCKRGVCWKSLHLRKGKGLKGGDAATGLDEWRERLGR